jgi:hypothetical protein
MTNSFNLVMVAMLGLLLTGRFGEANEGILKKGKSADTT